MWCNFTVLNKGMHTISKISVLLYTYYAYCMICIHVCIFMYIICIYSHVYDCTCTAVLGMKQTITYATVYHMLVRSCCLTQRYMYQNQNLSMRSLQIQWDYRQSTLRFEISAVWKKNLFKVLIPNKSCWHHSKNIKSGLRITWQSNCNIAPSNHLRKKFTK